MVRQGQKFARSGKERILSARPSVHIKSCGIRPVSVRLPALRSVDAGVLHLVY